MQRSSCCGRVGDDDVVVVVSLLDAILSARIAYKDDGPADIVRISLSKVLYVDEGCDVERNTAVLSNSCLLYAIQLVIACTDVYCVSLYQNESFATALGPILGRLDGNVLNDMPWLAQVHVARICGLICSTDSLPWMLDPAERYVSRPSVCDNTCCMTSRGQMCRVKHWHVSRSSCVATTFVSGLKQPWH